MEVKVENKTAKKRKVNVSSQKWLIMVQCWLNHGQELDGKMKPFLWTEHPTCTLVGVGSLWPIVTHML
jgi:hypothetical protein